MSPRLGFWTALAIVFVCGILSGFVIRASATALLVGSGYAIGVLPTYAPGTAASLVLTYLLLGVALTAAFVKVGVSLVTSCRIGYGQAVMAGMGGALVGLLPTLILFSHPASTGMVVGLGLFALPLGLIALALHACFVTALAEA
jgi:hypothetical protein